MEFYGNYSCSAISPVILLDPYNQIDYPSSVISSEIKNIKIYENTVDTTDRNYVIALFLGVCSHFNTQIENITFNDNKTIGNRPANQPPFGFFEMLTAVFIPAPIGTTVKNVICENNFSKDWELNAVYSLNQSLFNFDTGESTCIENIKFINNKCENNYCSTFRFLANSILSGFYKQLDGFIIKNSKSLRNESINKESIGFILNDTKNLILKNCISEGNDIGVGNLTETSSIGYGENASIEKCYTKNNKTGYLDKDILSQSVYTGNKSTSDASGYVGSIFSKMSIIPWTIGGPVPSINDNDNLNITTVI